MDNAQLYLSLVRPSMIPVVGESADDLFRQQIEVTGWKWGFHNVDEQKEAERKREEYGKRASYLEESSRSRNMKASLKRLQGRREQEEAAAKFQKEMDKLDPQDPTQLAKWVKLADDAATKFNEIGESTEKAVQEATQDQDLAEEVRRKRERAKMSESERRRSDAHDKEVAQRERAIELENLKFSFSFTKRIDLATTQMLNSMKAGDVFPLAIFTMHQYSSNNPMSLVIKIEGLRLMKYGFAVDTTDTMTDLKEEWSCDFKGFSYVYQNRRSFAKQSLGGVSDAKQIAAKAATQGTVRAFVMMPRKI